MRQGDIFSLAAFGPSGRFRGGATSPRERVPETLRNLLKSMIRRQPGATDDRLRAFSEIDLKPDQCDGVVGLGAAFRAFQGDS